MKGCWVAAVCLVAGFAMGCGKTPEPKAPQASPPPEATAAAREPEPDLSPVGAPADLFFLARIVSVEKIIDTATQWAGFPFQWRSLLKKELPGLDRFVAFDAPIDVAAMLDPAASMEPEVLFAVSLGVTSIEDAAAFFRERGESVQELPRGLYRVEVESGEICRLGPSLGPTAGRITCSDDETAVDALAPYMARGLPTESLGSSDVHLRVLAQPFRRRYGPQVTLLKTAGVPFLMKEIGVDDPRLEVALKDTLYGLTDELIDLVADIDRLALDMTVAEAEEHVDVSLSLGMAGTKSWTAQTLQAASAEMITAPELFYQLPSDATSAGFRASLPAERVKPIAEGASKLTEAALSYLEAAPRVREPLVEALKRAISIESRVVSARFDLTEEDLADYEGRPESEQMRAALRAAIGHNVAAVDGEDGAYQDLLSQLSKLLGNRSLEKRLKEEDILDELPEIRRRHPRGASGLPRGTYVYSVSLPGAWLELPDPTSEKEGRRPRPQPFEIVMVVAPKGETTFFGLSADEKELYVVLKSWLEQDDDRDRLAEVSALQRFGEEKVFSAGLTTPRGLAGGSPLGAFTGLRHLYKDTRELSESFRAMPSGGMTPLVWASAVQPEGPTAVATVRITKDAVQDVAAGLMSQMGTLSF